MPIVFVHGVAVRQGDDPLAPVVGPQNSRLWENVEPLLREHVAPAVNPHTPQDVHIAGFYWGDLGVQPGPQPPDIDLLDGAVDLTTLPADAVAAALQEYGLNFASGKRWPQVVEAAWRLARAETTRTQLQDLDPPEQVKRLTAALHAELNDTGTGLAALLAPVGEGAESIRRRSWRRVAAEARKGFDQFSPIFVGDILTYQVNRGTIDAPGPSVTRFADTLNDAAARGRAAGEPLIVLTHSMGGQLMFDTITAFPHLLQDVYIDLWCAAGGQVGVYKSMGLFLRPDVRDISAAVGYVWNAWSSSDLLSFPIEGRIGPGHDTDFAFGSAVWDSHGTYLSSTVFFQTLAAMIGTRTQRTA